jgi:hypothetical protein
MSERKDTARAAGAGEEAELRAVLALASNPPPPGDAMARLMARIGQEPQETNVVPFAPRGPAPRRRSLLFRTAAALPLAASLALGVYLGAKGTLDFMLPTAITGGVAMNDDAPDDLGGVGEADAYAEENLS